MSYERKQIPAMIEVFEDAKAYLWDGVRGDYHDVEEEFVCCCIYRVSDTMEDSSPANCALDLVTSALGMHVTLNDWLESKGRTEKVTRNSEVMQSLRLKWIDKIIADLKEYANDAC